MTLPMGGDPRRSPGSSPPRTLEEGLATLASLAEMGRELEAGGNGATVRQPSAVSLGRPHDALDASPEHSRRVAEARYRTLIEQIPAVTFLASLSDGRNEIYVSPQIESLLGFTQEEWVSDPVLWYRQTHPDDRDRVSLQFAELCLTGKPFRDIVRVRTRAGETVWVDAEARLVRDEEGQLLFLQGVGFDVTDQYRAREAREQLIREQAARAEADRERDRLREIFTGLPAAIALLRLPEYTIEFLNPVAMELAGPGRDVLGRPFAEVFAGFAPLDAELLDRIVGRGQPWTAREIPISSPDGQAERYYNIVCQPLRDDKGPLVLVHAVEVTEQVQARRAVEDALQLRDEFMSIASHELKTPIAALQAQAQLMLRRAERNAALDPQRVVQAFRGISGQASRLTRLVGQLLDVSRLQAGKLEPQREWTDLVPLVQGAVASTASVSEQHPITFNLPASLCANVDPLRLEEVVANLVDNAVKYSPDGGQIEVHLRPVEAGSVELSVRDHGLGIPLEQRGQIFERFYQAHTRGHRSGLGLGLYICRQIVEMHGGSIHAEFPPDGGTRFVVRLALDAAAASSEAA